MINPLSGGKDKSDFEQLLQEKLDLNLFDYTIYKWLEADALKLDLTSLELKYFDAVVAVGGDGTINQVIDALKDETLAFGLIPQGSGNGLARELSIPLHIPQAIERLNNWQLRQIDLGVLNGQSFVNVSGIGFDAAIGFEFAKSATRGVWGYFTAILRQFFKYQESSFAIEYDGQGIKGKYFIIAIANGRQWGNEFYVAREASLDDGILDLTIIRKPSILQIPGLAWALRNRKAHKLVDTHRAKHFSVLGNGEVETHLDGEPIIGHFPLEYKCLPSKVAFLV